MLTTKTMNHILQELAKERPVFHSEADFQFALAEKIKEDCKDAKIRLEYPVRREKNEYADILVTFGKSSFPIELKYKTKKFFGKIGNEEFHLAGHSAANHNRYRFLKDVQRIEQWDSFSKGFVVFLTNEPKYWQGDGEGCDDKDFRIHDGARKSGELAWRNPETKKEDMAESLNLSGAYVVKWEHFSMNGEFRYVLFEVKK